MSLRQSEPRRSSPRAMRRSAKATTRARQRGSRRRSRCTASSATHEASRCPSRNSGVSALAQAALHQGDRERAALLLTEGLTTARKRGDKRIAAECLHTAGGLAAADADPARAARLWGAADALRESTGAAQSPAELAVDDEWLTDVRNRLGDEEYGRERSAGRELDLDAASQLVRA